MSATFALTVTLLATLWAAPAPPDDPVLVPPSLTEFHEAAYPAETDAGEVAVVLAIAIEADGSVSEVTVLKSGGEAFDHAASEAARRFRFTPATEDGVPIPVEIEYRYVFSPPEPEPEPEPTPTPTPTPEPEPEPTPTPTPADGSAPLQVDDTAVVHAVRPAEEAAETSIEAEAAERIAGAQGDAIKASRSLAGVARPSATGGELVVWGASPLATRRYVDWIPVPTLFHLGGSRSVLPTPFVHAVGLVPAGFGPAFGRATGGLMRVDTRPPRSASDARSRGGFARVDAIDVGAGADTRLGRRAWVGGAVRKSLLEHTYGNALPERARSVVPLPTYWDFQTKGHVRVDAHDDLELIAIGSRDAVTRSRPAVTPDRAFSETRVVGFQRFGARLQRARADGSSATVAAWLGRDDGGVTQTFETVGAHQTQRAWHGGLRVGERRRLARIVVLDTGVDLELTHTVLRRGGALTLPPREGDVVVFGQPPGDRVAADRWVVDQVGMAGYASLELSPGRWSIEPGLRVEPIITAVDRILPVRPIDPEVGRVGVEIAVDPRARIGWRPGRRTDLFVAGGRYQQAPSAADLSAVFGNPELTTSRAYHTLGGGRVQAVRWLSLAVTGFWIRGQREAARSQDPTPPVARLLRSTGDSRNYGGQFAANLAPHRSVRAALSYAYVRAQRRRDPRAAWRRADFDQPHLATAWAQWEHRTGVELGARVQVSSGFPRTEVVDAVPNVRTGDYGPVFGPHNAIRLPTFFELSARIAWHGEYRWGQIRTWLDVVNATNHRNAEEVFYRSDYGARDYVRGLPIVPSLGAQVQW